MLGTMGVTIEKLVQGSHSGLVAFLNTGNARDSVSPWDPGNGVHSRPAG